MKISHKDWQGWFVAGQRGEIADYQKVVWIAEANLQWPKCS